MLLGLAAATAFVVEDNHLRRLLLALAVAGASALTLYLRRLGSYFILLWPWVIATAAVAAAAFFRPLQATSAVITVAKGARMLGFFGVLVTLDAATVEAFLQLRGHSVSQKLGRLALLYAPYVVINGLTTWVVFLSFAWFSRFGHRYPDLDRISTPPGLEQFEFVATVVIGALGLFALLAPIFLYVRGGNSTTSTLNGKGKGAQDGLLYTLMIAPVALLFLEVAVFGITLRKPVSHGVLAVYGTSVLRTIPLAGWLVGPFAVALRVIGDVLFYIQPNPAHPAAIGEECRKRLRAALTYCRRQPSDTALVIAHSQGSVIAVDLRRRGELEFPLLTLGSPTGTLYRRFLDGDLLHGQGDKQRWINAYRDGDYIGGPIECAATENRVLDAGGHTKYWSDTKVRDLLNEMGIATKVS